MPLAASVDDRSATFQWNARTAQLDLAFAVAADVLRNPAYDDKAVRNAAAGTERQLPGKMDPAARADRLPTNAIWGDADPPGGLAQPEDYHGLTRDHVVRFHAREIGPTNATLLMVGDITPAQALALAERHFGDWRANTPAPSLALPVMRLQAARIVLVDTPGAPQSSITVGQIVPPFDKDRDPAEQLANAVLAGNSNGRLNMNLREAKSWTYGFGGGVRRSPVGDRVFVAQGAVQTDKTVAAIAEIRREIDAFITKHAVTAEELQAAKSPAVHSVPSHRANVI